MGFLTSFPPYLSPCSLTAFFRKQKQRRKPSSASLQLQQENHQQENEQQPAEAEEAKRFRKRFITVGPISLMQSYNRHIRNHAISRTAAKQPPPVQLSNFELVPVHNCRLSNRTVPGRRNELCECCPIARSGHRIFVDGDFIYVIGGYNQILSNDKTYTDAWRFNRLTQQWQQCILADPANPLPNTLASFSLVTSESGSARTAGGPRDVYIFGGTGFPFGQEATNNLHRIRIDSRGRIHIQLERREHDEQQVEELDENDNFDQAQPQNFPPRMYGHAMCYRLEKDGQGKSLEVIYLAGGTTGHIYNMDVWRLERPTQPANSRWKAQLLNMNGFETGRYRLEAVLHGQMLLTFGGGAPEFCAEFDEILTFNLNTRKFELLKTHPDPVFGIPRGRKCHALVQQGTEIYIIGGCRDVQNGRSRPEHQIINDIWRFDLDTFTWSRMRTNLPVPVYFHSAALSPDGCLYVFGGCVDEDPYSQTRINRLQRVWLRPPSLKQLAAAALLEQMPDKQRQRITADGAIRLGNTEALIARLFEASLAA